MKLTFTMLRVPETSQPKHSTRFNFERLEEHSLPVGSTFREETFRPSFYVPKPVVEKAIRVRVTIEEIE